MESLREELEERKQLGLYRQRRITQSAQSTHPIIDGKTVLSFCSNDYLGLANHPEIKQAYIKAASFWGVGSGSAHLVNGHTQLHQECEQQLAEFTGRDRALLFSTGYMANLAITSALVARGDSIFQDKLNHASLIDAARLSSAGFHRYPHHDLKYLQRLLTEDKTNSKRSSRRLVMTDAVFSMDGDKADLDRLVKLCNKSACWLMIDDAHGFGVLGNTGAGLCEEANKTQKEIPILMATLGKAVGVSGAFVAGSEVLIETLIQRARSYIYTTASPPSTAAAVMKSIDIIQRQSWRREKLAELIDYFKQRAAIADIQLMPSNTAIQPVVIGDNQKTLKTSQSLFEQGIHVAAIRPPTVPKNTARLRITLSAAHEKQEVDKLINTLSVLL